MLPAQTSGPSDGHSDWGEKGTADMQWMGAREPDILKCMGQSYTFVRTILCLLDIPRGSQRLKSSLQFQSRPLTPPDSTAQMVLHGLMNTIVNAV